MTAIVDENNQHVTRNVILDLLPLYEAGEVSADTRALVDAYLREHPEMKPVGSPDAMFNRGMAARPEHERRQALERTRSLLRKRQVLFGVALACSLLPFAFAFDRSGPTGFLWDGFPGMKLMFAVVAVGCWIGFWNVSRQLRVAGM
jgi:hypothetical protein